MAHHLLSLEAPDTRTLLVGRTCEYLYCNNVYDTRNPRQKYCSKSCCWANVRMKNGRWVYKGETIQCKGCKKDFIQTSSQKVYCTIECSKIYIGKSYYQENKEKWQTPESRDRRLNYKPYRKHKKNTCELCGFVAINSCQLDVDHINGNHNDNNIENLQTLCANCHRLKTFLNKDGVYKSTKILKLCITS